jgi:hypothetical protein
MLGQDSQVIIPDVETMPDFFGSPFAPEVVEEKPGPSWGLIAGIAVGLFLLTVIAGKKGI